MKSHCHLFIERNLIIVALQGAELDFCSILDPPLGQGIWSHEWLRGIFEGSLCGQW